MCAVNPPKGWAWKKLDEGPCTCPASFRFIKLVSRIEFGTATIQERLKPGKIRLEYKVVVYKGSCCIALQRLISWVTELACWTQIRAKNEIAGICESMGKKGEFSSDEGALQNTHNYVLVFFLAWYKWWDKIELIHCLSLLCCSCQSTTIHFSPSTNSFLQNS